MQISCPDCQQRIRAEDIDLSNRLAKCSQCHEVFSFGDIPGLDQTGNSKRNRLQLELPTGIRVEDWGPNLKFVRSWFTPWVFILLAFCVVWNGFLLMWYGALSAGLGTGNGVAEGVRVLFYVIPLGHVAIGVLLSYYVLCCLVNKTTVEVGAG